MAENKKELLVTIKTPELRYAVMNKTHVTARSLQASGKLNYEAAAAMQVSEDNENSYELVRSITDALAEVKVELGEYLNETNTTADNMIPAAVEASAAADVETQSLTWDNEQIGSSSNYTHKATIDDMEPNMPASILRSGSTDWLELTVNGNEVSFVDTSATVASGYKVKYDSKDSGDRVHFEFELPSNFNSAAADALGAGIHEFVVGRSIYAWYRQTVPELSEACRADAEASLERVKKALYKRSRPTRPYQN